MLSDMKEIHNPAMSIRCTCGVTYFDLDENTCLACECDFYKAYERNRFLGKDIILSMMNII